MEHLPGIYKEPGLIPQLHENEQENQSIYFLKPPFVIYLLQTLQRFEVFISKDKTTNTSHLLSACSKRGTPAPADRNTRTTSSKWPKCLKCVVLCAPHRSSGRILGFLDSSISCQISNAISKPLRLLSQKKVSINHRSPDFTFS